MQKTIEEMIFRTLKTDSFTRYKKKAENGDCFSANILGDIFFYGITADDAYFTDVERATAMMKYVKKLRDGYFKKADFNKFSNMAVYCECGNEPDLNAALKMYKIAAECGSSYAKNKIEEIEFLKKRTDNGKKDKNLSAKRYMLHIIKNIIENEE